MAGDNLRKQIRSAMEGVGVQLSPDILSKCLAVATSLHVSPTQMAESWEAFSLNKNVMELDNLTFSSFRSALIEDVGSSPTTTPAITANSGAVVARTGLGKRQVGSGANVVTPPPKRLNAGKMDINTANSAVDSVDLAARVSMSPTRSLSVIEPPTYDTRTNSGQVVDTYNPRNLPHYTVATSKRRCVIGFPSNHNNVLGTYRYMFTPIEDRAEALESHLLTMGEEIIARYNIRRKGNQEKEEGSADDDSHIAYLAPVCKSSQETVCCIGRICNEAHEGRINSTSILLEGSRMYSSGHRVKLNVSNLIQSHIPFSLFPGQIIAVEGINATGHQIVAERICEGAAPLPIKTTVANLMRYHYDAEYQDGQPLKFMSVCGPYTTSDNLDYQPLIDLLHVVKGEKPDVVIMAGPFVDMKHEMIKSGHVQLEIEDEGQNMTVAYETLFFAKVAELLEDLFAREDGLETQFILVPSLDDAVAEWVYPQPPLADRQGTFLDLPDAASVEVGTLGLRHIETAGRDGQSVRGTSKRVHCVSNPCTLQINELTLGITSTDVLLHISTDETNGNLEPGSRLTRVAQHLLQQQSYYPLFPPPAAADMAMNLDLNHMKEWKIPCQPDILIIPSKLTTFARKVLDSTVVINPGHLSRGKTGGTYAVFDVQPMKRETLETAGAADIELDNSVQERIRVEIKRI